MKLGIKMLSALGLISALTVPHLAGASPAKALPTIFVTINGKAVNVSGTLTSGAVNIRLTVTNEPLGSLTLIHLKPGVTFQTAFAKVSPDDLNTLNPFGAVRAAVEAPRGVENFQAVLPAGQYVALDTSNQNGGRPPSMPFILAKSAVPAKLPPAGAAYNIIDFGFRGPAAIRNGEVVRIHNAGWVVHMAVLAAGKARRYAAAVEIKNLLLAGKDKQAERIAPVHGGFSGPVSHGSTVQLVVHAQPGYYVLACFMDTQDHREHTQLGMLRIIRILP